jgi:hypothetical protein
MIGTLFGLGFMLMALAVFFWFFKLIFKAVFFLSGTLIALFIGLALFPILIVVALVGIKLLLLFFLLIPILIAAVILKILLIPFA